MKGLLVLSVAIGAWAAGPAPAAASPVAPRNIVFILAEMSPNEIFPLKVPGVN